MLAETFRWWLAVEAVGLIALPIVFVLFQRLPGRGIAFAKPAGLLLLGYSFWLALSLHLLPNRPGSIVWAGLPLILISLYLLRRHWQKMAAYAEANLGYIVAVELVFFVGLFAAAHIRSFLPEIAGTEKPMDFLFLNAASRSRFYPPDDPWLAGSGVSYYYFGYVINAIVGKMAALQTSVAFNLALAGTIAMGATAAFGLGYELARLVRRTTFKAGIAVGAGAILLLSVIGNLEGVIELGIANDVVSPSINDTVQINDLETARVSNDCLVPLPGGCLVYYPSDQSSFWWWWRSTRISPDGNSITEFPFFSFILGDLHPHVMAIPFVLTAFALGLSFWAAGRHLDFETWTRNPALLFAAAVLLGGLGFLNTWDLPTFGFLLIALVLARNYLSAREATPAPTAVAAAPAQDTAGGGDLWANSPVDEEETTAHSDEWEKPASVSHNGGTNRAPYSPPVWLQATGGFVVPLVLLAALLYLPFYVSFSSQASGFDTVVNGATRPLHSALFWGILAVVNLPLPFILVTRGGFVRRRGDRMLALGVPALLLAVWVLLTLVNDGASSLIDAIGARGFNWLTFLFFATGLGAALLALRRQLEPHMPVVEAWDETPSPPGPPAGDRSGRGLGRGRAPEGTGGHDAETRAVVPPGRSPSSAGSGVSSGSTPSPFIDDAPALVPVLIVMATGLLLILGAELFFVKDVFGSRLNTVFKLSYQAWLLLAVSGAYSLWWLVDRWQPQLGGGVTLYRSAWATVAVILIAGGLIYPLSATLARTNGLDRPNRTLDGLQAARAAAPDDYAAIGWLRDRAGQDERIVEGTGGQYSAAGRVASATGIPTVIGWVGHEVQWGRDGVMLGRRQDDVDALYTTDSMEEALRILQQYRVTYVFVGSVERAKYPPTGLEKFDGALPLAARFGEASIYRVPRSAPEPSNAAVP